MATLYEFDLAGQVYRLMISQAFVYLLDDGTRLPVQARPAWCEGCRKFIAAEGIPSRAELEEQLREAEYYYERPGLIPPDRRVDLTNLSELRARLQWRSGRLEPAKCLTCESSALTPIDVLGSAFEIPGRGTCVARFRGWADAAGPGWTYCTPEGRPTPRPRQSGKP